MTWTKRRPFRSLPRPASPLQHHACTMPPTLSPHDGNTAGAHRSQKIASAKFRDHGAPGCHLSDESLQAFRSKHGYNNYDPDADKFYARKARSKESARIGHRLAMLCEWWRLGASAQTPPVFTPCRLSIAAAGRPQASCPGRRPPRPAADRYGH